MKPGCGIRKQDTLEKNRTQSCTDNSNHGPKIVTFRLVCCRIFQELIYHIRWRAVDVVDHPTRFFRKDCKFSWTTGWCLERTRLHNSAPLIDCQGTLRVHQYNATFSPFDVVTGKILDHLMRMPVVSRSKPPCHKKLLNGSFSPSNQPSVSSFLEYCAVNKW